MGLSQTPQALVPAAFTSGGMTLLSTTTLSGATTTVSSINQSYKDLKILVINALSTNISTILGLRLNGVSSADYAYEAYPGIFSGSATEIYIGLTTTNTAWNAIHSSETVISRYAETESKHIVYNSFQNAGAYRSQFGRGIFNSTTAITSITLTNGAGTFTSGTMYVYGVS